MELLAKAVKEAARIREESYDQKKSDEAARTGKYGIINFNQFYKISLRDASDQACEKVGFDTRGTLPVYLLLNYCWNDILDWAETF